MWKIKKGKSNFLKKKKISEIKWKKTRNKKKLSGKKMLMNARFNQVLAKILKNWLKISWVGSLIFVILL